MQFFKHTKINIPVIIVGNITVGGTGKTPLVITIVDALKQHGFHPGIISRGYRGKSKTWPQRVNENSDPMLVGEEAVLMAKKTGVPVVVGPKRVDSALCLTNQCDVIVSDDGLQHYALDRDIEIVVIDGMRQFGNGFCLPAGPLREPKSRLKSVDFVVINDNNSDQLSVISDQVSVISDQFVMRFIIDDIVTITNHIPLLHAQRRIIAVAGIGNPKRFFNALREKNITFTSKIFPDHYQFKKTDFNFLKPNDIVIMTEKDAVKCMHFATDCFYVARGHADVDADFMQQLMVRLQ